MTSSIVSVLPLWNSMPLRTRIVHSVASAFGVTSSARSGTMLALASCAVRQSYSCGARAKSRFSTQLLASRVSEDPPPELASVKVPPRFGVIAADVPLVVLVFVEDELPQAASNPPAPSTAAPPRALPRNSRREYPDLSLPSVSPIGKPPFPSVTTPSQGRNGPPA